MPEQKQTVLVTGIGGNVGQGILRVIRQRFPEFRVVGTDINRPTPGHHFCNAFYQVPYAYELQYRECISDICLRESIGLIIPATDYEAYHLSTFSDSLPPLIASPPETTKTFLDKYETFKEFCKLGISFAKTYLPSEYPDEFKETIVKPREGRGSRGLFFNPEDPQAFDDSCVVQPLLRGQEITTAFYVTRKGHLLGHITFERELVSGMTERCQVTDSYDEGLSTLISSITANFPIKGPCNIQSIVTAEGQIIPFEINCRYSGTSSIRSQLGFSDVSFGIQEYLLNKQPESPRIVKGSSIRIYMDIIYRNQGLGEITPGDKDSYIF